MYIPSESLAKDRIKSCTPILFFTWLAFHSDLYKFIKVDVVGGLVKGVLGVEKVVVRGWVEWLFEKPIYAFLLFNLFMAARTLIILKNKSLSPPITSTTPTTASTNIYSTPKPSSPLTRGYIPSPKSLDRPSLPFPTRKGDLSNSVIGSGSVRLRSSLGGGGVGVGQGALVSSQSQGAGGLRSVAPQTPQQNQNQNQNQAQNQNPNPNTSTQSQPQTQTPQQRPPSPTLSQLLSRSAMKHKESTARGLITSQYGSGLSRSISSNQLGLGGSTSSSGGLNVSTTGAGAVIGRGMGMGMGLSSSISSPNLNSSGGGIPDLRSSVGSKQTNLARNWYREDGTIGGGGGSPVRVG